ncbi:MAG TPA: glycosyltransferase family 4 protein [Gemmatimonadaceae bacterium]|nr:glycosyltransferase family 4 protein [Gemmatimonadaceae bacterium]
MRVTPRRPLRIGMLTTFYPPYNFGGDGIGVERLATALARRGHEVTVLHDVDAYEVLAHAPVAAPTTPPVPGLRVIPLRSGLGPVSPLLTQQAGRPVVNGRRIRRIVARERFDVTFFHNVSLIGGAGLLGAGAGVTLYEAHEHWLVCPSHVLWRHGREPCTGRQCLRCTLRHHRPPQLWRYTGYLERQLRHVDAFIAKSEFSRRKHHEFGFTREMEVIPYFLPDAPPAAASARGAPPHDRPYVLFVGRLERIKGLDDVIPAMRRLPELDLVVAGDGEHGPVLRRLADGVANVRFLGRVAPDALRAYYDHALALVVPSVCFETFGIILIEAFRQGTPVIARRIGPFPEIVERAGGGLLFETPDELVAALHALHASPARRAELARAGAAAFARHWSESAVLPQYLELIARTAAARGMAEVAHLVHDGAAA